MLFEDFVLEIQTIWIRYLSNILAQQKAGNLDSDGGSILYPNILLVTKCTGFYAAELIGAKRTFSGLATKRRTEKSIYRYLGQFNDANESPESAIHAIGRQSGIRYLCLGHEGNFEAIKSRFPTIELYKSRIVRSGGSGSLISFGPNFESYYIANSVLVNKRDNLFRCKSILLACIFKSSISRKELFEFQRHCFGGDQVVGVHTVMARLDEQYTLVGQLQNLYFFPGLHETTIGEFLKSHPSILKSALNSRKFLYEPYLLWKEHDGTCEDKAINPDLLVKRSDGFFDIYDLKTALLNKPRITKGARNRRRFVDLVADGVAQLANYREYFSYPANIAHAKEKYGIEIREPRLALVVGSWENSSNDEIKQACRAHSDIDIIDYDSLCQMFLSSSEKANADQPA